MFGAALTWVDGLLVALGLSPWLRVVLWAVAGGISVMGLYRGLSPQHLLRETERHAAAARKALIHHDGPFGDALPLIKQSLGLSFKRLGLTLGPALIAGTPMLALLLWMGDHYAHRLPRPGETVQVKVRGEGAATGSHARAVAWRPRATATFLEDAGRWQVVWPQAGETLTLLSPQHRTLLRLPPKSPAPEVTHRQWHHWLLANPAGYLPPEAKVEAVEFDYPRRQYIPFGPSWARSWLAVLIGGATVGAIGTKIVARIQ